MVYDFNKLPGYSEAVTRETEGREFPFLGLTAMIAGLPCEVMRLKHLRLCLFIKSPFICGGDVEDVDICRFLWILSPDYSPTDAEKRMIHQTLVVEKLMEPESYNALRQEISDYLGMVFFDAPEGDGEGDSGGTLESCIVHCIAKAYGWTREVIERETLPALFQYMDRILSDGKERVIINRLSDKIVGDFMDRVNAVPEGEQRDALLATIAA